MQGSLNKPCANSDEFRNDFSLPNIDTVIFDKQIEIENKASTRSKNRALVSRSTPRTEFKQVLERQHGRLQASRIENDNPLTFTFHSTKEC